MLTTNWEYSRSNRENLPLPVPTQLSEKLKPSPIFYCICGMYIKFGTYWKKNEPHSSSISEVIDSERRAYFKCIKGLVSENPSVVNVLNGEQCVYSFSKCLLFYRD